MSKRKIGGVMASTFIAGAMVCGSIFASGNQVMVGGSKQGKALWTDYCGMSKEVQGTVDAILFTQSPKTAKGDPYQNYPHYVPEGSRIVSYNLNTKELKVLTNDFATAFDPCTYWDGKKFAFAGIHKKGGRCQIWEINIDGSGLRQMTDYKGTCRSPIYYAAGSIEEGKGRIIWRDRYFEGDWKERGTVEKTGFIIFAGSPDGVMDEFHNPYAYNLFRLDTQGGHVTERITGHVLSGIEFPNLNTTIDQITYNISSNFDPALTPDGNILFSSVQANGSRAGGKGRVMLCVDNWDGAYPRPIYGNCDEEIGGTCNRSQAKITFGDRKLVYIESPYMNWGVGQLVAVSWDAPYNKTYEKLSKDEGGLYRSPYPLPDDRMLVSYAERGDFGIYWFDCKNGRAGDLVHNDPEWNDHQPTPIYIKYKPRWINTFTAGKNFGVTTVTYQPFDQVKVEGYPHSWGTWICFDTTLTDLPVGPYPHQRAKDTKQGDVKAVRIVEGAQCVEPDASKFRAGAGSHLIGGARSSSNSGTAFQQRRIIGYQYVEDDGSVVTSQTADTPYYIQNLDERGMAVQTALAWAYLRPYHGRICSGCHDGSYRGRAFQNLHSKALYNWWYDDRSHYDSPFAFGYLKFDRNGIYQGVKHGNDIVVPSDVYYGSSSGTTSQPVEGLTDEKRRTVDFRRDLQPIIDAKCANCHNASNPPDLSGGAELVSVNGIAAFSRAYNRLLEPQGGKDPNLGGRYVNPSAAINSLLIWRLYEEKLSQFAPRENVFPIEGRVIHDKFLTQDERYLFVEWIDIGAQWDNIPGPDFYPGYTANGHPPSVQFPEFPWPPPQASAFVIIPAELLEEPQGEVNRLCDVDKKLRQALEASGYVEKSYFAVPDGFALVTRLEQINIDGTPKQCPDRWITDIKPHRKFSLKVYLRALFTADPGYYRIIVFIVTPYPFSQSEVKVDRDEAMNWLREGLNKLPSSIARQKYTVEYVTTSLIYEFEQSKSREVAVKVPGRLTGRTHLKKSGLMDALGQ